MEEEAKSDLQIRREELETALPTTENKLAALMAQAEQLNDYAESINESVGSIKGWVTFFGVMSIIGIVVSLISLFFQ